MAELVIMEIQKYRAADGNLYDCREDAERADREFIEDAQAKAQKAVDHLHRVGMRFLQSKTSSMIKNSEIGMYTLLTLKNKYRDLHFLARNIEELKRAYFEIFLKNHCLSFYSDSQEYAAVADIILQTQNFPAAVAFVRERRDYEYERVLEDRIQSFEKESSES